MLLPPRSFAIALAFAACIPLAAAAGGAQPTFGKPKPRPNADAPANPKPAPANSNPTTSAPNFNNGNTPAGWSEWRENDPERSAPKADAQPGKVYAWKTGDGLRYTWTLPKDYTKGEGYDLILLCHPDRADFRWASMNHPAPATAGDRAFRPGDIVVGIDGTTVSERNPDLRSFVPTDESIVQFRDLVLEISRTFPVNRIYLYGMGGGGEFAQCFAAAFPALTDGVVVHGCAAPPDCVKKGRTPLVFMHGAKDLITPLHTAFDARSAYDEAEHTNVRLRILQAFNDFPNPVRASECLDWAKAMRTDKPEQLLASVRAMLTPKRPDEYEYRTSVWFGAARQALERLTPGGDNPIKNAPPEAAAAAKTLIDAIEAHGAAHIAALRTHINAAGLGAQSLDGGPWLGHLIAMREDFRGVRCADEFFSAIGFDALSADHDQSAIGFAESWSPDGDATGAFEDGADAIQSCWLSQLMPLEYAARMRSWGRRADDLKPSPDALEKFEYFQNWEKGWTDGLEAYEAQWRKWEVPG